MHARLAVEGLKEATARVDEIGDRARRPEPALRAPGTLLDLQQSERRKFARGGWRKDTAAWVKEKRRRGLDARTLRATGQLESALVNATRDKGVRFDVYNAELRWGIVGGRSDLYYAAPLTQGARGMPPRRMIVIDPIARENIAARVQRFIVSGFMEGHVA